METSETKADDATSERLTVCDKMSADLNGSSDTDDINTESDDASTETDDSIYAPDGGWGWMVTAASFMVAFIVDGIVTSYGLLLPELLTTYGASVSLTSFPPAIIVAMFLLSGPLTAYLVRRWGCRIVGFLGGLLAALGLAASAYAPTIDLFILSFGVVAGLGIGLIYLPSVTMVNIYFNKKRGIVAGIITSGSGFGLLAMAPLTEVLMEEYGWRGCYLVMAGITLNFCVCASLMRPLAPPARRHGARDGRDAQSQAGGSEAEGGDKLSLALCGDGHRHETASSLPLDYRLTSADKDNLALSLVSLEEIEAYGGGGGGGESQRHTEHHHHAGGGVWSSVKSLLALTGGHALSGSHVQIPSRGERGDVRVTMIRSVSHGHLQPGAASSRYKTPHGSSAHVNVLSTWLACQVPPSLSRPSLRHYCSNHSLDAADLQDSVHGHPEGSELPWSRLKNSPRKLFHSDSRVACDQASRPLVDQSGRLVRTVLMNSRQHKAHGSSLLALKVPADDTTNNNNASFPVIIDAPACAATGEDVKCSGAGRRRRAADWVREYRVFLLFLVGAFLIQLVNNVPALLTPSYSYLHGVTKEQVATILAVFGLLNTVGRLAAGWLVYWGWSSLRVYNLGTLLAGLTCFAFPLCSTFPSITACLGLHGLFLGAFPPLQSVLLVEYLGIERLASTFGTMCLVKAFASSAGAPLAGLLYGMTGVYTTPVVVCGGILVLAAIFHQMMACCSKPRTRNSTVTY